MVIVVHPGVPAQTIAELVALGKRRPGKLAFRRRPARESPTFLGVRMLEENNRRAFTHDAYKGVGAGVRRSRPAGRCSSCSPKWGPRFPTCVPASCARWR